MKGKLNEVKRVVEQLEYIAEFANRQSENPGDDWSFLTDMLVDAKAPLMNALEKIHVEFKEAV